MKEGWVHTKDNDICTNYLLCNFVELHNACRLAESNVLCLLYNMNQFPPPPYSETFLGLYFGLSDTFFALPSRFRLNWARILLRCPSYCIKLFSHDFALFWLTPDGCVMSKQRHCDQWTILSGSSSMYVFLHLCLLRSWLEL